MSIPDPATLSRELVELIRRDVLPDVPRLDAETDLFDAGLDSMAFLQLLLAVEARYGVMLSMADLTRDHFATATDLARLLGRALEK